MLKCVHHQKSATKQSEHKDAIERSELRVVTYNAWFENFHLKERAQLLLQTLKRAHPHLIGLQEGQHCLRYYREVILQERSHVVSSCSHDAAPGSVAERCLDSREFLCERRVW